MDIRVILLLFVIVLAGCKRGQKEKKIEAAEMPLITDSTYIFDGMTLNGWEITNFGPQGPVYVSGGEIILGMGEGCTGITYKKEFPRMNYKVTLAAKRLEGNDFFCGLTFPVGDEPCSLIIGGWGGTTVGLSSINGNDASENETTTLMKFEKNIWYGICLVVKENTIKAWINDSLIIDFQKNNKKLSIRPEVELSKPFGIASWYTTAALKEIRVDSIGEEIK